MINKPYKPGLSYTSIDGSSKPASTTKPTTGNNNTKPGNSNNSHSFVDDLSKYGIDYSQEEQDRIANIFKQQADTAYKSAQNQYSQDMANQQNTLRDTIRRSQAEAVATGASRGMQAANELSAMLGLQQEAAKGATSLQSDYAEALAQADKNAADVLTQRGQTAAEIAAADIAAQAQKYASDQDFKLNDFMRVIEEAAELRKAGRIAEADMLLRNAMSANGLWTAESVDNALAGINNPVSNSGTTQNAPTFSTKGSNGLIADAAPRATGGLSHRNVNYKDLKNGKPESFDLNINGQNYYVKTSGTAINSKNSSELYKTLCALANDNNASEGKVVYYNNAFYVGHGGGWSKVTATGDGANVSNTYEDLLNQFGK